MLSLFRSNPKLSILFAVIAIGLLVYLFSGLNNLTRFNSSETDALCIDTVKSGYIFSKIIKRKKIIAVTHNNTTGYFIYKGQPLGIHYDMLKSFAKKHDLELEVIVEEDLQSGLKMLENEEADILAIDLTYTKRRNEFINFTHAFAYNRQVLVQRKKSSKNKSIYLKRVLDLEGKKVYVQKGAIFIEELRHISEITGSDFQIIVDSIHTQEELVLMVSNGQINYTACDERVAEANQTYVGNLDLSLCLSVEQKLCWAVSTRADSLKLEINEWLEGFVPSRRYAVLNNRYFKASHSSFYTDQENLPIRGGQLTPFDDIIKKHAKELDWDWRLLASMIYQESRFNPRTTSWAGAQGLMQLMPRTGDRFDLKDPFNPEENIRAGVAFLKWIERQFDDAGMAEEEKVKFMLASYNVGLGHVLDAQKLARKYGKESNVWTEGTDTFIILKTNPVYYNDPVVKHGYCHGQETFNYVQATLKRFKDYQNLVPL